MAARKGKAWTKAQHKKFAATMKRKKAQVPHLRDVSDISSIPLDAIPERVKGKKPAAKKKGPVTAAEFALALDLLDLAVKMLRMAQ